MEFDFAHAAVSVALILAVVWGLRRAGLVDREGGKLNWIVFVAIFVVIFILNLIWPV